jgi:hypothetical protein
MRFSLKWPLAGMAYVALATAAIARSNDLLASGVWWLTLSAIGYAMLCALNKESNRGAAVGFLLFAISNFAACYIAPQRAIGSIGLQLVGFDYRKFADESGFFSKDPVQKNTIHRAEIATVGTANALGTMAAGLAGAVVGVAAFRNGQRGQESA